jgi:hypothetical protein
VEGSKTKTLGPKSGAFAELACAIADGFKARQAINVPSIRTERVLGWTRTFAAVLFTGESPITF